MYFVEILKHLHLFDPIFSYIILIFLCIQKQTQCGGGTVLLSISLTDST